MQDSRRLTNSGFFARASNVDASNSNFSNVGGNQTNIHVYAQNETESLDNLPRATKAGYSSKPHKSCLEGTRKEVLQEIEMWEVDQMDKSVYWLKGGAGYGKSAIAQTFAERSAKNGRLGASFFCSRDFPDRRNLQLIFPTLAHDLAHRFPLFKTALIPIVHSNPHIEQDALAFQLEKLLVRPLKETGLSFTIVIDALDECVDKDPVSGFLSALAQYVDEIPTVKFFITGRPEDHIRYGFIRLRTKELPLHGINSATVDSDIKYYVRSELEEIVRRRKGCISASSWPSDEDVCAILDISSGLFIIASTIIRFIDDRRATPKERLKRILDTPNKTTDGEKSRIDVTYSQILEASFMDADDSEDDREYFNQLHDVVGSIVLALNPLSRASLAKILTMSTENIYSILSCLHSVLIVPESESQPIMLCHKSFADFITDSKRCHDARYHIEAPDPSRCVDRSFYVDRFVLHTKLGTHCLRLMNGSLKKNICGLPPYTMNKDIEDLDARREQYIGGGLEYACRSWAKHLQSASRDGDDVGHVIELLECFFKRHLLSWLEVLSIGGDLRCGIYSLRDVRGWFTDVGSPDMDLLDIIKDSERFILRFFDSIEASPCHIYHSALAWSPRSSVVRTLYQNQTSADVKMSDAIDDSWDASMRTIQTQGDAYRIAFSHKDDFIAVCEPEFVEIFETLTGQRRATFTKPKIPEKFLCVAFSPDDTLLATGHYGGIISMWDLQTGGLVCRLEGHTEDVGSVSFSPCGTMITSGSDDKTVRIWDVLLRNCRCVLKGHSERVWSVCWLATRDEVLSGSVDGMVRVWDVNRMRCIKSHPRCVHGVHFVACSPDSSVIAFGSTQEVKVFNAQTSDVLRTISLTNHYFQSIRFLDQDALMYATSQSTFVIHDLMGKTNTLTPKSKNWFSRCFEKARIGFESLQRRRHDSEIDLVQDAQLLTFKYEGYATAISSDGTRLASRTSNDTVTIWQTDGPNQNHATTGHHKRAYSVAVSGDGQLVASGSWDDTAKLWDPTTGRCLHTFSHPDSVDLVIFSPDSTLLASATSYHIRIWDTRTYNLIATIDSLNFFHYKTRLAFSPNGNRLVSLGRIKGLELWEVATGKRLASLDVDGSFEKVEFCVDGTSVILEKNNDSLGMVRYGISPTHSSSNDDKDKHSSPQLQFVPLHDTQQSQPVSLHLHCYRLESEWIIDEQKRRVLWVPPDLRYRSDYCGKKIVLGSLSGRVAIIDILDVQY